MLVDCKFEIVIQACPDVLGIELFPASELAKIVKLATALSIA